MSKLLFFLFLSLFSFIKTHTTLDCPNSNFTSNSTYETNVNQLLASLTAAAVPSGYANKSQGQPPDQVFGIALCRGDTMPDKCQACLAIAINHLRIQCPLGKDASTWEDKCNLAYSSTNFSTDNKTSYRNILLKMDETDTSAPFVAFVQRLMGFLISSSAYESPNMFAMADAQFTNLTTVYGLVQCTRDQSGDDCYLCLQKSLFIFLVGTNVTGSPRRIIGGVVGKYHCYFRYETYQYYNMTMPKTPLPPSFSSLMPPPPPRGALPLTVPGFGYSPDETGKKRTRMALVLVPVLCGSMAVALLLFSFWRRRSKLGEGESQNTKSLLFDANTLRAATNKFSDENKLGEGGFGPVYKGVLPDGQQVAVKRLSTSSQQGLTELTNEVYVIAQLQHKNLVRLLGYCWAQEKLLVYEYLPNTSLDKILFNSQRRGELNWERRYKIIQGIASGLAYLHHESRITVIHRDLKPGNILLDQHMNPKISDFGLSKLHDADLSKACASRLVGTYGYIAPEYACNRHISTKSDVYSYGMLALEVITGRSINHFYKSAHYSNLQTYAWKNWRKGEPLVIVDANLGQQYNKEEALRCIHIALLCIQADPSRRPNMVLVMQMQNSCSMTKANPQAPAFLVEECESSGTHDPSAAVKHSNLPGIARGDDNQGEGATVTVNEITTSIMDPR